MLSILDELLDETGSGPVLEPISKPVLEPVREKLGWFCFKLGSATLPPV